MRLLVPFSCRVSTTSRTVSAPSAGDLVDALLVLVDPVDPLDLHADAAVGQRRRARAMLRRRGGGTSAAFAGAAAVLAGTVARGHITHPSTTRYVTTDDGDDRTTEHGQDDRTSRG